eukprot:SAG31_NODE_4518_length_3166_cov_1.642253_4_plen_41_part_00
MAHLSARALPDRPDRGIKHVGAEVEASLGDEGRVDDLITP